LDKEYLKKPKMSGVDGKTGVVMDTEERLHTVVGNNSPLLANIYLMSLQVSIRNVELAFSGYAMIIRFLVLQRAKERKKLLETATIIP